jgi:hypothetical protein
LRLRESELLKKVKVMSYLSHYVLPGIFLLEGLPTSGSDRLGQSA